ncbi:fimbrial protein [Acinetobacter nectaris]|uniref:fimbrial protein n=1 Tax=Acinetobacter nectaris TaxID=1219382 RepID=UPI001F0274F1|nr:fimbrial protein [Acinetobacter nectaris]MCF8998845.1 fimbrial protein [Acinetobacter nectaris]MCF9027914.1 fimbrial protein [Acinetobacter nectaris]
MPIIRYICLVLFFAFFTSHSYASCLPYRFGFFTVIPTVKTIQQNINLGRIVVKPSDSIGQVLKEQLYRVTQKGSYLTCDFMTDSYLAQGELSQRRPLSNIGNNIYSTNLGGIGIRISIQEDGIQKDFPFSSLINTYFQYFSVFGYRYSLDKTYLLKVQIIKTDSNTESGSLNSGRYVLFYTDNNKNSPLLTVDLNSTTIASSSCLITNNNTTVKLNDVTRSSFRGIGSVQGEQNFQVNVLCNGGDNFTSDTEQNQIGVSFNYIPSAYNSQAIKNTSTNTPASGVDLQLLWSDRNEVVLNNYNYSLGSIVSNDTQTFPVSLKARYIQTQEQVTPGQVQGLATITINYK